MAEEGTSQPDLTDALRALADKTLAALAELREEEEPQPIYYESRRWRVDEFRYDENGPFIGSSGLERLRKPVWQPEASRVYDSVKSSPEFGRARSVIEVARPERNAERLAELFATRIASVALDDPDDADATASRLVEVGVRELQSGTFEHKAIGELIGINLLGVDLSFERDGVTYRIRQPQAEDYEREFGPWPDRDLGPNKTPSGILEVSMEAEDERVVQQRFWQAMTVLRLFRPTFVACTSLRVQSESAFLFRGEGEQRPNSFHPRSPDTMRYDDTEGLLAFWDGMWAKLERAFPSKGGAPDHLIIAYQRYLEALPVRFVEQCIATAVMGLEALLSDGGGSLRYKLSVRTAALLAPLGLPARAVKDIIYEAYRIRSKLVHGDRFKEKDQQKLVELAGDVTGFWLRLNDYLRFCLVVFIGTEKDKKQLIALVDDALVDKDREEELARLLGPVRPFCSSAVP